MQSTLTLALVLAALLAAPALAAPSPVDQDAVAAPEDAAPAKASPRYIQTASEIQDADDNSLKQVYYEADSTSTDLQLHQGVSQGEQAGPELATSPQQSPAPISLGGIMSSVWDLVVSWVRGFLGLQRHDPPRVARAILGAAAGDEQCWRTTACNAGRLLRGLHEKEFIFMMMERLSPPLWKDVVKGMRRSAIDYEDCRVYECDA